jgi:hypothetical protein
MTRSTLYWLPCLGLVLASFSACGGVNAGDLFSSSGGSGPSAGSPSNAGEPGEGGAGPAGGSSAGGRSEAGESSGGSSPEAGASTGGASMGGAGTGGDPGIAGMGGGSSEPNCQELFERAAKELTAAQACNIAVDAKQCTGKVETTCGCQVYVQRGDSAETKAYEDTLKQIEKKKCVQQCPAIVCAPANFAQCKVAQGGGIMGTCTSYGFQQD